MACGQQYTLINGLPVTSVLDYTITSSAEQRQQMTLRQHISLALAPVKGPVCRTTDGKARDMNMIVFHDTLRDILALI